MSQSVLTIGDFSVRQLGGLFSLNDLHTAAGAAKRHAPNRFMRLDNTKELLTELGACPEMGTPSAESQTPLRTVNDGTNNGTYACRELVIAYAAWISAAFHLKVIRVFLQIVIPESTYVALPNYITKGQQGEISTLIHERFPDGRDLPYAWGRFNNHFRLASYKDLPASRFAEACGYIRNMPPKGSVALPINASPSLPLLNGPEEMVQVPQHVVNVIVNSVELVRSRWKRLIPAIQDAIGYELSGCLFDVNECTNVALRHMEKLVSVETKAKLDHIRQRQLPPPTA